MKKNNMKKFFYGILITSFLVVCSCAQPSPLNGTWADNKGNQITLMPDLNYSARIVNSFGELNTYNGSYNVLLNAISFTADKGYQVVSEWDIRGNMLYLTWPDSKGHPLFLTLYKTKN